MEVVASAPGRFDEAMADDFNTALAIAVLFDLARATNGFRQRLARRGSVSAAEAALLAEAERVFAALGEELLGVIGDEEDVRAAGRTADDALVKALVELLLEVRQKARAAKDWATADAIRARLGELGIVVEDTAAGSRWRFREE